MEFTMSTTACYDMSLDRRALFSVADAAGVQITCREGAVWITLDNDPRDIVLEPDASFTATDHRRAIVYALQASRVTVRSALPAAQPLVSRPAFQRPRQLAA
ncbi:MAG: DUF2917 domain-containing protein [Ramlibacter sp.]|nr:DUF2917 domain-containing protein [Ramlibacter sp.]MBX3658170.1 DUF2917 domain-containing protein [Ramlibacter sp.]